MEMEKKEYMKFSQEIYKIFGEKNLHPNDAMHFCLDMITVLLSGTLPTKKELNSQILGITQFIKKQSLLMIGEREKQND